MAKMKSYIVFDDVGPLAKPRLVQAENSRAARSKYIGWTSEYTRPGRKRTVTVLRDTKRNRRKCGLLDKQEQKASPVRTRQIAELKTDFDSKRTQ